MSSNINPSTQGYTGIDMMKQGSLTAFYSDIDSAIVASEVVKASYKEVFQPCYATNAPVAQRTETTISISCSGDQFTNIDASNITGDITVELSSNQAKTVDGDNQNIYYFVGWKFSKDTILRYQIFQNDQMVIDQSDNAFESFLRSQCVTEQVRNEKNYIYSTYDNVSRMRSVKCGAYVRFNNDYVAGTKFTVPIRVQIPLNSFLPLASMRYILGWMGKWEIKLFFDPETLVVLPIDPRDVPHMYPRFSVDSRLEEPYQYEQIGSKMKGISQIDIDGGSGALTITGAVDEVWTAGNMYVDKLGIYKNYATLRADVNNFLKNKYIHQEGLMLPVQVLKITRFTQRPNLQNLSTTLTTSAESCDTLYVLTPKESRQKTVFRNPYLNQIQLQIDNYGVYPQKPYATFNDQRYLNMVADSINVNSSEITSFNKDTSCSFSTHINVFDAIDTNTSPDAGTPIPAYNGDNSNFFVGFPFSSDGDFQGGFHSSQNCTFQLTGTVNETFNPDHADWNSVWIGCFLIDGLLGIMPNPHSDSAAVTFTAKSFPAKPY